MTTTTLEETFADGEWKLRAACRGHPDPDLWFPDGGPGRPRRDAHSAAVDVCRGCTVRARCLDYALARDDRHGVWGGRTPSQRVALGHAS
ncbi:WhiB family transcriptional regulator [Pseudonocardia sp. RS010]|uniref:WhiB family transcriptional regulator n=1 Tax=Pseudonocardia sp. RS010 TaxID=3385979 RepID=UPI00399FDA1F